MRPEWETRGDARLMRVVDTALASGVRRAGDRLACRVGCTECCLGPFPITLLDARRLTHGLRVLRGSAPRRAAAVGRRARAAVRELRRGFPGDPATGRLSEDETARDAFFERHEARPCPALDPRTGACELYDARPLTCRTYGLPVRVADESLPPCRLCFVGAKPQEIARCRVTVDPEGLEDRLLRRLYRSGEPAAAETVVAFALGLGGEPAGPPLAGGTSPEAVAREALELLRAKADPRRAQGVQAYFKESVRAIGVTAPQLREIVARLHRQVKATWTVAEAIRLCDLMLPRPELEAKGVAILVLHRYRKTYPTTLFDKAHAWLAANHLDNWASVDALCPEVVGALLGAHPPLVRRIESWARSENRWVRRASIVSLLKLARRPEHRDVVYAMARRHFDSHDDLVQKAAGWLLREVGKQDMGALDAFLRAHGARIPRTTLRYAIERFPPSRRRDLLESTRGAAGLTGRRTARSRG